MAVESPDIPSAISSSASSANLLGGEGIRHAMDSADQLADLLIAEGMSGHSMAMAHRYQEQLKAQQRWRWLVSGRLARRTCGASTIQGRIAVWNV